MAASARDKRVPARLVDLMEFHILNIINFVVEVPKTDNRLTPVELQSRFGGNPFEIQVSCPQLSPKRNCSPKRIKVSCSYLYA